MDRRKAEARLLWVYIVLLVITCLLLLTGASFWIVAISTFVLGAATMLVAWGLQEELENEGGNA